MGRVGSDSGRGAVGSLHRKVNGAGVLALRELAQLGGHVNKQMQQNGIDLKTDTDWGDLG